MDEIKESYKGIWKYIAGVSSLVGVGASLLVLIMILGNITPDKYMQIMIGVVFLAVVVVMACMKLIKDIIGLRLASILLRLKRKKSKGFALFKEFNLNGKPDYHIVNIRDAIIKYDTKINGQSRKGIIFNHPYARYNDFAADIPVIEGSYADILPKNYFTGNRIGTNPDLVEKVIVDSGITQQELDDVKKHRRWLTYLLVGIAIAGIVSFDLYSQRLAEAYNKIDACYQGSRSATIIAQTMLGAAMIRIKKNGRHKSR